MFTCRWTFFRMIDSRTYILIWRLYRFKRIYAFRCPPYSNTILRLFDFGLHLRIILRPRYILWWFFKLNKNIFTRYSLPNLTWALFGLRQASESRTLIWISMTLHGLFRKYLPWRRSSIVKLILRSIHFSQGCLLPKIISPYHIITIISLLLFISIRPPKRIFGCVW